MGREKLAAEEVAVGKLREYFEHIHRSGDRLLLLLNDLLDLSKLEAGKTVLNLGVHELAAIVRDIAGELAVLADEKGMAIDLDAMPSNPWVECDRDKIAQVLRNLLSNAIRYSPPNSRIRITASPTEISGRRAGDASVPGVLIGIQDEGVGIPAAELEFIFDKFVQSSATRSGSGGTGLGLAICREIVELHGGGIHAENNPGRGASLIFSLRLKPSETQGKSL